MNTNPQINGEFSSELAALTVLNRHFTDFATKTVRFTSKPTANEQRAGDWLWSNHDYQIEDFNAGALRK